jgi:hypothetical protein
VRPALLAGAEVLRSATHGAGLGGATSAE